MTRLDRIRRNWRSARAGDCGHPGPALSYRGRRRCLACTLAAIPRRPHRNWSEDELREMGRLFPDPH